MRAYVLLGFVAAFAGAAAGQGVLSDVMSGKLIDPEVGVFAWYELKDAETGQKLFMRQAIVGKKQVAGKAGFYLETEIMPEIGFPVIYKMLLTGPATDPANVHEIMIKDGTQPVETLSRDMLQDAPAEDNAPTRDIQGTTTIETPAGAIEAEHVRLVQGDTTTEVWLNDDVRPMGIVKMISADGELLLTRFGVGGPDAESAIDRKLREQEKEDVRVEVVPGPSRNFSGRQDDE